MLSNWLFQNYMKITAKDTNIYLEKFYILKPGDVEGILALPHYYHEYLTYYPCSMP